MDTLLQWAPAVIMHFRRLRRNQQGLISAPGECSAAVLAASLGFSLDPITLQNAKPQPPGQNTSLSVPELCQGKSLNCYIFLHLLHLHVSLSLFLLFHERKRDDAKMQI